MATDRPNPRGMMRPILDRGDSPLTGRIDQTFLKADRDAFRQQVQHIPLPTALKICDCCADCGQVVPCRSYRNGGTCERRCICDY